MIAAKPLDQMCAQPWWRWRARRLLLVGPLAVVLNFTAIAAAVGDSASRDYELRPELKPAADDPASPRSPYRMIERTSDGILGRLDVALRPENVKRLLTEFAGALRAGLTPIGSPPNGDDSLQLANTVFATAPHRPDGAAIAVVTGILPTRVKGLEVNDPFEVLNRFMFNINSGVRDYVLEPFAVFYESKTSPAVRASVQSFFHTLREPVTIVSSSLLGKFDETGNALARFGINTTLGIGGLFDQAAVLGFPHRPIDLEQTLCQFGFPAGPYVVLPILGPATARDAAVRVATVAVYFEVMGVAIYVPYRATNIAINYSNVRDNIDFIDSISLDPYVAYRTLYLEMRNLSCGKGSALEQYFTR